ncbi:uncharacterized protein LY89DRAFT_751226 [Mollisia scopiformis]|uniref:Uncharacterized protein n=1 Tax=Mollisia scopiformis TaxID=149040 RepID=A0A194X3G2_MOLSC|nr:uncharacterized protein LY89DRAFT_751226 [Mollisia scopiformis]KUJ14706.1 hypothetical protein LY89DRAFT_751226 [Mollisia scopiformis]
MPSSQHALHLDSNSVSNLSSYQVLQHQPSSPPTTNHHHRHPTTMSSHHSSKAKSGSRRSSNLGLGGSDFPRFLLPPSNETLWEHMRRRHPNIPSGSVYNGTCPDPKRHGPTCPCYVFIVNKNQRPQFFWHRLDMQEKRLAVLKSFAASDKNTKPEMIEKEIARVEELCMDLRAVVMEELKKKGGW